MDIISRAAFFEMACHLPLLHEGLSAGYLLIALAVAGVSAQMSTMHSRDYSFLSLYFCPVSTPVHDVHDEEFFQLIYIDGADFKLH